MTDESVPSSHPSEQNPRVRRVLWYCTLGVLIFISFTAGYMAALSRTVAQTQESITPSIPIVLDAERAKGGEAIRFTDFREFLKSPLFVGKVTALETLPLRRGKKRYHSAAMPGYRLEVVSDSGEKYEVVQEYTDANWQWTGRNLKVGRTYLFPDAVVKDTQVDETGPEFGKNRLPPDAAGRTLARKLLAIGFKEGAKWSYFIETDMKTFKKWFPRAGLRPIPCLAPGENKWWTSIDGNHAVVSAASSLRLTADGQIRVSDKTDTGKVFVHVLLEWARPKKLYCRMTETRALAALGMIGARCVGKSGSLFPRSHRFVLPDGTGLLLECVDLTKPGSKPLVPSVSKLIVGEKDRGFVNWEGQKKRTPEELPIWGYLKGRK